MRSKKSRPLRARTQADSANTAAIGSPREPLLKRASAVPRPQVPAFVELVVMDEFGIRPLRPTPRGWIEFVGKDAHGNRDGDAFALKYPLPQFPNRDGRRKAPCSSTSDVMLSRMSSRVRPSVVPKDARDQLVAARVVIEEISRQADGRIRDSVQRLRPQPHLEPVGDSLLIDELQTLVSDLSRRRRDPMAPAPRKSALSMSAGKMPGMLV
jgi:hypothetical protein